MTQQCWVSAELAEKYIFDGILHNKSHSITYFDLILWLSSADSLILSAELAKKYVFDGI